MDRSRFKTALRQRRMAQTMGLAEQGTCPRCQQAVAVDDGFARDHRGRDGGRCSGSGARMPESAMLAQTMAEDPSQDFRVGQSVMIEVGSSGDEIRGTVDQVDKAFGGYGRQAYRYTVRGEDGKTYKGNARDSRTVVAR